MVGDGIEFLAHERESVVGEDTRRGVTMSSYTAIRPDCHFAVSVNRLSRTTVTLISPG